MNNKKNYENWIVLVLRNCKQGWNSLLMDMSNSKRIPKLKKVKIKTFGKETVYCG